MGISLWEYEQLKKDIYLVNFEMIFALAHCTVVSRVIMFCMIIIIVIHDIDTLDRRRYNLCICMYLACRTFVIGTLFQYVIHVM